MSRVEATLAEFYRGETIASGRYAGQPAFTNAWQIAHDRLADGSINELIITTGTLNIPAPAAVDVGCLRGRKVSSTAGAGSTEEQSVGKEEVRTDVFGWWLERQKKNK